MRKKSACSYTPRLLIEELEPRLLLSADLAAFADLGALRTPFDREAGGIEVQVLHAQGPGTAGEFEGRSLMHEWPRGLDAFADVAAADLAAVLSTPPGQDADQLQGRSSEPEPSEKRESVRRELVLVDPATPHHRELLEDLNGTRRDHAHIEVVMLESGRDGVEQVTEILKNYRALNAVHIVSHGTEARLDVGSGALDGDNLHSHARAIESWGRALNEGGDLLVYGCGVAGGPEGRALLNAIAKLTQADVAASTDATGNERLGGDWELEFRTGDTETAVIFSAEAQSAWKGLLATDDPLWLTTNGDVSGGGQPGSDTWQKGDLVEIAEPNLAFEPDTTSGTFAVAFDGDSFAAGPNIDAVHYVSINMRVGSSNFELRAGDLLLSTSSGATFSSTSTAGSGFTNNLAVKKSDVFVFRPDTAGDYSAGTFAMLLEDPTGAGHAITGISLLERDTTVGDAALSAGDFLFTRSGAAEEADVWLFETADVGAGNTSGTSRVLLEGSDADVNILEPLVGIDVVENPVTVGGRTLDAGTLLLTVDSTAVVGSNLLPVNPQDVFALEVTKTTLIAGLGLGQSNASLVFEGAEVAFDSAEERLDGVSLTVRDNNSAPVLNPSSPSLTTITEDDLDNGGDLVSDILGASVSDADGDPVGMAINGSANGNGAWEYSTDGGSTWQPVGAVGDSSALLLRGTDRVRFVPDGQDADSASITYRAWDQTEGVAGTKADASVTGGTTAFSDATDTASITVNAVNDAPVNAVPGPQATDEDSALVFSSADGNAISISDVDAAGNDVEVTLAATNGTLTLAGTAGLTFSTGDGSADASMTFAGTLADINAALDGLTFDPTPDYNGAAALNVTTDDLGNTGAGGAQSDTDSVDITVNAVNDAPVVATNAGLALNEGATAGISAAELETTDPDNTPAELTYTVTAGPGNGQLELTTAPGVAVTSFTQEDIGGGRLVYVHDGSETTSDNFTFDVTDGTDTVSGNTFDISLTPVNDAPVNSVPERQTTPANTPIVFSAANGNAISVADVDAGTDPVQVTLSATNGVISLSGTAGLTFSTGDGASDAQMTFSGTLADINAALDGLAFTPDPDFNGTAGIEITADDGGSSGVGGALRDTDTVSIGVGGGPLPVPEPSDPDRTPPEVAEPDPLEPSVTDEGLAGEAYLLAGLFPGPAEADRSPGAVVASALVERSVESATSEGSPRKHEAPGPHGTPGTGYPQGQLDGAPAGDGSAPASYPQGFIESLDRLREETRARARMEATLVGSMVALSTSLSVGYVLWLIRGGLLLASLLSSMPAWRVIDPLPVLARFKERPKEGDGNEESLDSLLRSRQSKPRAAGPTAGENERALGRSPDDPAGDDA